MSVITEKSEQNAVIEFGEEQEYCDKANLFLMGQSQGGLVTALETAYADSASQLVLISGKQSVHAFDVFYQQGQEIARNAALDYVESHLTE